MKTEIADNMNKSFPNQKFNLVSLKIMITYLFNSFLKKTNFWSVKLNLCKYL